MTVLDQQQLSRRGVPDRTGHAPVRVRDRGLSCRPGPARPDAAIVSYRGAGVSMSRAPHAGRPVGTAVTMMLAAGSALITVWLGALAQFGGNGEAGPVLPADRLAVVQVQAGETLPQLAGRVAPDAPVDQTVARIRQLNELDSVAVDAGQTLIAPVG